MTASDSRTSVPLQDPAACPAELVPGPAPRQVFSAKPTQALVLFVALAVGLEAFRPLRRFHLFPSESPQQNSNVQAQVARSATMEVGETTLVEESKALELDRAAADGATSVQARGLIAKATDLDEPQPVAKSAAPPVPLEDPSGHGLDQFLMRLKATAAGQAGAITRIVHFGDSVVASDYVSSTLRRRFQEQFGDAGHGFTLIANAWPAYFHEGVSRFATSGWLISRVVGPLAEDGWHGLGGVSFRAPPNLLARIGTAKKGDVGRRVSRFVVAYVASPEGGKSDIRIDGVPREPLDTRGPEKQFRTEIYDLPDGEHELEIQTTKGTSRFFGVVLERAQPGVVLDAIGIQGARIRFLDKQDDAHFRNQLAWRDPGLVIYQFGANESADGYAYSMTDYHETMKAIIAQQREALPRASCLILSAMDRASRKGDEIRSLSIIPLIVAEQRKVATELGCAFFDTFRAMGGNGSMPRWFRRGLGQSDLTHPTAVGAEVIGNWVFRSIMQLYRGDPPVQADR